MKVFPDTSVLMAACGSKFGASREVFRVVREESWSLMTTPYVLAEVEKNIRDLGDDASTFWRNAKTSLVTRRDVLTMELPVVFSRTKDRPVLFSAFAWADVLLTLDRRDFGGLIGSTFYNLPVMTPGMFVEWHRKC